MWTLSLPDHQKHVVSFEVTDFGEEFDVWVQTTEVQLAQVSPGALLERKECFHQCMIVHLENLGHASSHFQMSLGIDQAKKVLQCSEPSTSKHGILRSGHSRIGLAMPACSWNHSSPIRNKVLRSCLLRMCLRRSKVCCTPRSAARSRAPMPECF
jgi:hypothetical protein